MKKEGSTKIVNWTKEGSICKCHDPLWWVFLFMSICWNMSYIVKMHYFFFF